MGTVVINSPIAGTSTINGGGGVVGGGVPSSTDPNIIYGTDGTGAPDTYPIDAANGIGLLDASGKFPTALMPVGDVTYLGNWNATTNTPTLANGAGTAGDLYICDVAGSQDLGGGVVSYGVGDWLIYDGATWDQVSGHGPAGANPSVTVGLTAKNGTADTYMRSDGAPALDVSIAPTWTGAHTFREALTVLPSGGNGLVTTGTNSTGVPSIAATGAAVDIALDISAKGSSGINLKNPTAVTGTLTVSGSTTINNALRVTGEASAAQTAGAASPTNSGINLATDPDWGMIQFYDSARTANNRAMDILFIGDGLHMRFVNDARNDFLNFLSVAGGQGMGVTGITSDSGSGAWLHTGTFGFTGPLMANGQAGDPGQALLSTGNATPPSWTTISTIAASDGKNAQAANVNASTLYAVPASGMYRVSVFIVVSQAATTSSTLPSVSVSYTEATTGTAVQDLLTNTSTANTVGTHLSAVAVVNAQQGSNLGYVTAGYASSGATAMQYSVQVKIESLI